MFYRVIINMFRCSNFTLCAGNFDNLLSATASFKSNKYSSLQLRASCFSAVSHESSLYQVLYGSLSSTIIIFISSSLSGRRGQLKYHQKNKRPASILNLYTCLLTNSAIWCKNIKLKGTEGCKCRLYICLHSDNWKYGFRKRK